MDKEILHPGESCLAYVKLLPAKTIRKSLDKDDAFTISEGNVPVGTGIIKEIEVSRSVA